MLVMVSMGTWAQKNPSVTFDDSKAIIEYTATGVDDYCTTFKSQDNAKNHFGEDVWNQIKGCTELVFKGKYNENVGQYGINGPFDAFNGVSAATTVDFKDAIFPNEKTQINWIDGQPVQTKVSGSPMTFKPWDSKLIKAITPKDPNAVVTKDMFNTNSDSKLEEVVFCGGTIQSFSTDKVMPNLRSVSFPEETDENGTVYGVSRIEQGAFRKLLKKVGDNNTPSRVEMDELMLPGTLTHIGDGAFYECDAIETVVMRPLTGQCTIGGEGQDNQVDGVFAYCSSLKHVTLSEGVQDIGINMFKECVLLESVRIPTTAREIKSGAFNLCANLHELIIPEYSGTGTQRIYPSVFENSGLTDIYVMARSTAKIPQIVSLNKDGNGSGTFLKAQAISNTHDPSTPAHRGEIENASDDEVMSWYTDEMSDSRFGRGGGDCMVILHYPNEIPALKEFYDGKINPETNQGPESWLENTGDIQSVNGLAQYKINAINEGGYISSGYAVGSEKVGSHEDYYRFGPSKTKKYWPTRIDYQICLQAGATATPGEFSSIGWRQLPIKQTTNNEDYIFTKKYDDTWYTMCFPWDMDDNTLFRAFNQKCEIAEFVGVEMIKDKVNSTEEKELYDLIFHFDRVAPTYYVTEDRLSDGRLYVRTEDGDPNNPYEGHAAKRSYAVSNKSSVNFYTYKCIESNIPSEVGQYIYMPYGVEDQLVKNITDPAKKAMVETYASITHLIAKAGHPYMIHPAVGAKTGHPADCTFAGVKRLSYGTVDVANKIYYESADALADANKVAFNATTGATYNSWETVGGDQKQSEYVNTNEPFGDGKGMYVFIGNPTEEAKDMLSSDYPIAYYLGAEIDNGGTNPYPKYYRKAGDGKGQGKWSPFTAIIRPAENAQKNIECYVPESSSSTNRNVVFGEWEVVDPTGIDEIIAEAEANNQEVKKVDLNVVFSVNGQVVRNNSTSVEGLPAGLYIVNGKKYMVK